MLKQKVEENQKDSLIELHFSPKIAEDFEKLRARAKSSKIFWNIKQQADNAFVFVFSPSRKYNET